MAPNVILRAHAMKQACKSFAPRSSSFQELAFVPRSSEDTTMVYTIRHPAARGRCDTLHNVPGSMQQMLAEHTK